MSLLMEELIVYLLFVTSNIASMFLLCNATMKRRRSLAVWAIYAILKTLIVNVVFRIIYADLIQTSEIAQSIYMTFVSVSAILTYIVLLYTFEEEFSKIAILSVCAELVSVNLGYISKAVTNILIGEPLLEVKAPLHIIDFSSAILTVLLTLGFLRLVRKWVVKVYEWEVRRKKTVMILFVIYMMYSTLSMYFSFDRMIFFDGVASAVIGVGLLILYINYFHREMLWRNDDLKRRQTIARMQYEAVVLQSEKMEQMQKEIQMQMKNILELSETAENKTEQIERYIMSLKQHSENVSTGIFCDDWFLDSVLHSARRKCQKKGIEVEFYLQGYQKVGKHSEELAKDVHEMLESAILKTKKEISLQVASMKGQIVIKLGCDGKERTLLWPWKRVQNW